MRKHEDLMPDFSLEDIKILAEQYCRRNVYQLEDLMPDEYKRVLRGKLVYTSNQQKIKNILFYILVHSGFQDLYPDGWYAKSLVPEVLIAPLEEMPLRINEDVETTEIAKWRLQIGK